MKYLATRITPAYAGNTTAIIANHILGRDHPRLRGEHLFINMTHRNNLGSPPPTRGTPDMGTQYNDGTRITPAYAGNTSNS